MTHSKTGIHLSMSHAYDQTQYRPDIDGLRAIAVLAVIAFHAFPDYFKGGFIGVDIFFVISGFLISNILLKEMVQKKFSLIDFYTRRIKRIFPALLLVLIACLLYGWLLLLPNEFAQLGKHILSATGFITNFTLYQEIGYFNSRAELKPLLHLWSLGIEEQFYIIWPLLLFLVYRWKLLTLALIVVGLMISFALNIFYLTSDPEFTFYLPLTRFWELMLGSLISYFMLVKHDKSMHYFNKINPNILSGIGVLIIMMGVFYMENTLHFPGWWALVPTLSALFIISAGQNAYINRKLLANKVLVFIGLISFPLYLWHWPLFSFIKIVNPQESQVLITIAAIFLSFTLAIATYYFVEKPIRSKQKIVAIPLIAGMVAMALVGYMMTSEKILAQSSKISGIDNIIQAVGDWDYPGVRLKRSQFEGRKLFSQGNNPEKVLFIGDSNVEQYSPRIDKLMQENEPDIKSVIFASGGGCPPIPNVYSDSRIKCASLMDTAQTLLEDPKITTIVLGALWFKYFDTQRPSDYYYLENGQRYPLYSETEQGNGEIYLEKTYNALDNFFQLMNENNKKIYLLMSIPMGEEFDPLNRLERDFTGVKLINNTHKVSKNVLMPYQDIRTKLREVALRNGVTVLDPVDILCNDESCLTATAQGWPIYRDINHLRPFYVKEYITFFDEVLLSANQHNSNY